MTERAAFPPGEAREDWKIFRALSEKLGVTLAYDTLAQLRQAMFEQAPHLASLDSVAKADAPVAPETGKMEAAPFTAAVQDFYFTNPIARASAIMADCARSKEAAPKPPTLPERMASNG